MKRNYEEIFVQVLAINAQDVITTSGAGNNNGDNEVDAGGDW